MPSRLPEQRRSLRFDLVLPVHVVRVEKKEVNYLGRTRNLSACGAYSEIDSDVTPGAPIEFIVTLQDVEGVQVRCQGRTTRAETLPTKGRLGVATTIRRYQFIREDPAPLKEVFARPSPVAPTTQGI